MRDWFADEKDEYFVRWLARMFDCSMADARELAERCSEIIAPLKSEMRLAEPSVRRFAAEAKCSMEDAWRHWECLCDPQVVHPQAPNTRH